MGDSLSHSLSPLIHNHFFQKLGSNSRYYHFQIKNENLLEAIQGIRVLGIRGVNVTFPYKEKVISYLDELDPNALRIRAVNTIKNTSGKLTGYNTDLFGIRETIQCRLKLHLKGKNVFLLGAGGAARACLAELVKHHPKRILVLNRSLENAERMVAGFASRSKQTQIELRSLHEIESLSLKGALALLVNATSAEAAFIKEIIRILSRRDFFPGAMVFDLNYSQRALSHQMVRDQLAYEDGLYTLCAQAAESFRIWTKIRLKPEEVFRYVTRTLKWR